MLPIRTILHPTDFSDHSDYAFQLACSVSRDYGARLVVLHIAEPPIAVGGEGLVMIPSASDLKPVREHLQRVEPADPKVQVEHLLIRGYAAEEILRVAAEKKCDLIVMGTHGRTGMGRLLMGSVAELVVRKAPCPVLTVKMPQCRISPLEASGTTAASKEAVATK